MRVRPIHSTESRRHPTGRPSRPPRRIRPASPQAPLEAPPEVTVLDDERRMRAAGGPQDRAAYTCRCGTVFEADVSTAVECPRCTAAQAW